MLLHIYFKLLIYITATFIGVNSIAMLLILAKYRSEEGARWYQTAQKFTLCILAIIVIYFYCLFIRFYSGDLSNSLFVRICDIAGFLGIKYFWLQMILLSAYPQRTDLIRKVKWIFSIFLLICIFNFSVLMDTQYYIAGQMQRGFVILIGIMVWVVPFGLNIYFIALSFRGNTDKGHKAFVIVVSTLIHFNAGWNGAMSMLMYTGALELETWRTPIPDPTSAILLLINLCIFLYIFKKDFKKIYQIPRDIKQFSESKSEEMTDKVDLLALLHQYALTEREKEIITLVYRGYSNSDIAGLLFISKHTVRNHIHNIFKKLGVSSRVELIHRVHLHK